MLAPIELDQVQDVRQLVERVNRVVAALNDILQRPLMTVKLEAKHDSSYWSMRDMLEVMLLGYQSQGLTANGDYRFVNEEGEEVWLLHGGGMHYDPPRA